MIKNIKHIILLFMVFLMCACSLVMSPSDKVNQALKKYVNNDKDIIKELNNRLDKEDLTKEEKNRYSRIIKKEYSNIKYEIKNEVINDNLAIVTVDIKVIDLYGASKRAEEALIDNPSIFYTNDEYDLHKFIDYKLNLMENASEYVDYTIDLSLTKNDEIWYLDDFSDETLEKLHGIYNYDTVS